MKLFHLVRTRIFRLEVIACDLNRCLLPLDMEAVKDNRETDEFINEFYVTRKIS